MVYLSSSPCLHLNVAHATKAIFRTSNTDAWCTPISRTLTWIRCLSVLAFVARCDVITSETATRRCRRRFGILIENRGRILPDPRPRTASATIQHGEIILIQIIKNSRYLRRSACITLSATIQPHLLPCFCLFRIFFTSKMIASVRRNILVQHIFRETRSV